MIGAILGDIVGSVFEFNRIKSKEFEFMTDNNYFTDDSVMTIAIGKAILESKNDFKLLSVNAIKYMQELGKMFPNAGYGYSFMHWLKSDHPKPYRSYGNGSAMRVSPCGIAYDTLEDVKKCAYAVTKVTHNHPEGLKAAEATAVAVFMAKRKASKQDIRDEISKYYNLNTTLDEIRPKYEFSERAKDTIGPAILSFLESDSFEDAIRNAVSLGGDSDTLAAIVGGVAGSYYGVSKDLYEKVDAYLYDDLLIKYYKEFLKRFSI